MLNYKLHLPLLISLLANTVHADKPDLPSPPAGFEWQWCEDVSVGILHPNQWHFKTQNQNATRGYFITKEPIDDSGEFSTGLSLNVIPNVGKKQGGLASDFARSFVRAAIQDKDSILQIIPPRSAGPAKTFGCRIKTDGTVMHYFLIADDNRDVLYLFMYESPEQEWTSAWNIGQTILQKLYVDFPE
ncbi:hypothetical protein CA51_05300 [Rosistilla oblonga]|uniref:hypothetical protein n=1 Tax=Rosistilla oblonga TaxID=2527990 RepID=UPI001187FF6E|nr:hypothetical protein [Rosistilla oblonga]QDV10680.1 hypothetical protein CA51_05300 [Rosistilla oblonga]